MYGNSPSARQLSFCPGDENFSPQPDIFTCTAIDEMSTPAYDINFECLPKLALFEQVGTRGSAADCRRLEWNLNPKEDKRTHGSLSKTELLQMRMYFNKEVGQICDSWRQVQKVTGELRSYVMPLSTDRRTSAIEILCQKFISQA